MIKYATLITFLVCPQWVFATTYLDGSTTGCSNGSMNYSPVTRSCGSGSDKVYVDLANFSANIAAGATNYIRIGNYFRDNASGSLTITQSGSSGSPTIVKAYPGEERQAIIGTATRGATYNSDPNDSTGVGSWDYYPNVAISITANYVTLDGIKTYGEISINGGTQGLRIINNDIGGGGPATSGQGAVLKLEHTANAYVGNNLIHNSCLAVDGRNNGPGIIIYTSNALIENNTFYDNYSADIYTKDSGTEGAGNTTEIRYNFFKPSTLTGSINIGQMGHNQAMNLGSLLIHHNIFLQKTSGVSVSGTSVAMNATYYNNTFVNCTTGIDQGITSSGYPFNSYNNLIYEGVANQHFMRVYVPANLNAANWNVYYNTADWLTGYSTVSATTLSGWQTYSGMDVASISTNPNFMNNGGSNPTDFKRSSYAENFTESTYSAYAGAYVDGTEIIGAVFTSSDLIPPVSTSSLATGRYTTSQSVTLTINEPSTTYYCFGSGCTPSTVYSSPLNHILSNYSGVPIVFRYLSRDESGNTETVKESVFRKERRK